MKTRTQPPHTLTPTDRHVEPLRQPRAVPRSSSRRSGRTEALYERLPVDPEDLVDHMGMLVPWALAEIIKAGGLAASEIDEQFWSQEEPFLLETARTVPGLIVARGGNTFEQLGSSLSELTGEAQEDDFDPELSHWSAENLLTWLWEDWLPAIQAQAARDEHLPVQPRRFPDSSQKAGALAFRTHRDHTDLPQHKPLRARFQAVEPGRVLTLNLGLGRDSFAMLCLLLEGQLAAQGERVNVHDVTAVVFSDTGDEWRFTYDTLPLAIELCRQAGLRFFHLQKPSAEGEKGWKAWLEARSDGSRPEPFWRDDAPGSIEARAASGYYHRRPPILEDYQSRNTTISLKRQDCTGNHKIGAIRRLIEDLAHALYGVDSNRAWGQLVRKGVRRPHLSLIGYAADEARRFQGLEDSSSSYVQEAYPLVELGIRKADEAFILERWQLAHVRKSGCSMCPFQPVGWYWALRETDAQAWARVLEYERRSVAANPRMTVLPGGTRLELAVDRWRTRHPTATIEAVLEKSYEKCNSSPTTADNAEAFAALPVTCPRGGALLVATQARVLLRTWSPLDPHDSES